MSDTAATALALGPLLSELAAQIVEEAVARAVAAAPTVRPATVYGPSTGADSTGRYLVTLDGDDGPVHAHCIVSAPPAGARVMVMLIAPHGALIVGYVGSDATTTPTGALAPYVGDDMPPGWLLCDGSTFSSNDHPLLAALVGARYGAVVDDLYRLPDLRGRAPFGVDPVATRLSGASIGGATGGAATHTLTESQMPSHTHGITEFKFTAGGASTVRILTDGSGPGISQRTDATGGGAAHNNMPPWMAMNWIVRGG